MTKKCLTEKDLENITGGVRPEQVGDPVILPQGIVSYKVCDDCGACMFPQKIRTAHGKVTYPPYPDYVCSECGKTTNIIHVFNNN